jgi:hypothetical protein
MRRVLAAALWLGSLTICSTTALALEVGVRGEYWFPTISGSAQTTTSGLPDTPFDIKDTLGVQDEDFPFWEAFLGVSRFTFRVGYMQPQYDGSSTLTQTFVFKGQTFAVNEKISTRLEMDILDGQLQFDLLRPSVGVAGFNLGLILQGKYVDGSIQVQSATTGITTREDFQLAAPLVGVAAGVGFLKDMIRADVRATGIAYSGSHAYEVDAYASFAPFPFVRLQGGYRYFDLKVDESDVQASLKLSGPYAGLQLSY